MPDESAPTPFENPYFLPVLLFCLAVWFGYDGWFNEDMADHRLFNRGGFALWVGLGIYLAVQSLRDRRKARR